MNDDPNYDQIREMAADMVGAAIQQARAGSEEAFKDILEYCREAIEAGTTPDPRITVYALEVLNDERVHRALFKRGKGKPADPVIYERDLQWACEVVRRQRNAHASGEKLGESDAISDTAEAHGVHDSLVKKAYNKHRKAAQAIETPADI